jgi:putative phosphoesterase
LRVAVISDTHMPRGARRVPDECVETMRSADLIVHAGDLCTPEVLDWLESLGPSVKAVHGNVDTAELRDRLPETLEFAAGDHRIAVIHDAGPANGRLARMRLRFPEASAVVFGHSHLPLHEEAEGFQIFNPGSPTERRRAPHHSFGIAEATGDGLTFRHVVPGT